MFGLPTEKNDRYKPVLIAQRTVSALSSSAAAPTRIDVPAVGCIEIQGDPTGVDVYTAVGGAFVGPFPTHRGDMFPGVSEGGLNFVQTGGSGTLRLFWWAPEVAPIRLAAAAAAAISGGAMSVDTELPAAAALSDATANPTAPMVGAAQMIFDGTSWTRVRSAGVGVVRMLPHNGSSAAEINTPSVDTRSVFSALCVISAPHALNAGGTYDRLRAYPANADDVVSPTLGQLGTIGFNFGYDPTDGNWDRLRTTGADTGALLPGYEFKKAWGDAVDSSTTGAKLTTTVPAAKDSQMWASTSVPAAGVTVALELVDSGASVITLRTLTSASAVEAFHAGPFSLAAGDALRWNVTVAAAGSLDLLISRKELR